ncbi:MAG: glycosyltransferase family 2 protein [Planctomycetota bacterium]|jgi:glycosyltransferase involved in cell wall biosynthesis|nr:MAG: glycosyltransferase family 2 protein [Planctomycetota bacterium]
MSGPQPRLPVSAVVVTRNAARHLAAVLAAADVCAELLVLDSGSSDDTSAIARAAGARVEQQPFLGFGPQKCRGVELAAHDWILSLDADEVLDDQARAAIRGVDLSDPRSCWSLRRRTFIGIREVRHGPWGNDQVLRLFNRTTAGFKPLPVHEEVESARRPTLLPGSILHYSYRDRADVIARAVEYAPLKAGMLRRAGQRNATWTLPLRAALAFAHAYLLRGGFRDGADGFVVALARAVESTLPRAMVLGAEPTPNVNRS